MSGCLFGFGNHSDVAEQPDTVKSQCPFSGAAVPDDDRFDYNKDPVAWFYQNQIKSEEHFQSKKAELRAAARDRLEQIFEKKGKNLIIDSDDEFSIATSELSAWDSDVHSIRTLASCANSWAEAKGFKAPALLTLRLLLVATMVKSVASVYGMLLLIEATQALSCWSGYKAVAALSQVNRYWGIVTIGWAPFASIAAASATMIMALCLWHVTDTKSKPGLLLGQLGMQLLCAGCMLLAVLCWLHPSRVDPQLKSKLCKGHGPHPSPHTSKLCHYLPVVQEQVDLAVGSIIFCNACLSALALLTACAGSWHFWELAYVEKHAIKHKRRRKHRKNRIPWEKIKVEDIGPVSYCGSAPTRAAPTAVAAATAAAVAAGAIKSQGKKQA